ncbi:uncharacterized protein [Triticum aestivum]|uniref:uncharacterized protein n=1 Tax=Triticum aestivum TaxID=4565 RepID=UPI001D01C1AC|nr:uncharacterized protein LOC123039480 [Triticum aestivum]
MGIINRVEEKNTSSSVSHTKEHAALDAGVLAAAAAAAAPRPPLPGARPLSTVAESGRDRQDPPHLTPAARRGFRRHRGRRSAPAPPGLAKRRSGALVRFLCFKGGAWADVEGEAAVPLRRAFLDGRVVAEAAYGGREFLFDFLWMVRIDAGTAEVVAMGWIDRGACFFPVPESGRKRKRGEHEPGDGASSEVDERSDESSDMVESSIQPNLLPLSSTPRAAGLMCRLPWQGYIHAFDERSNESSDKMQGQLLAAARGADGGNAKFAWYGAPSVDVAAAAVEHGFGRMNNRVLFHHAHGDDVHLSPPRSPYASATLANVDENGEAHIMLCRVLLGRPEAIPAGSSKLHPSSDNYDSAIDNMQNPQWYVVWGKDMNMRILPEYVVSFKCPNLHQMQGSSGANSTLKKPSPVAHDMFPTLLAEIQWFMPSSKLQTSQGTYNCFKPAAMKSFIEKGLQKMILASQISSEEAHDPLDAALRDLAAPIPEDANAGTLEALHLQLIEGA